jgi:hypothetical protein
MDVTGQRVIRAPRGKAAEYVMDWRNGPGRTAAKAVTLSREAEGGGCAVSAQVTRAAYFPGRRAGYVMDAERFESPSLIALSTADGRMARLAGPLMRATGDGGLSKPAARLS